MTDRPIPLAPTFHTERPADEERCQKWFAEFVANLGAEESDFHSSGDADTSTLQLFREEALALATRELGSLSQPVRLAVSVLCDLTAHGWRLCAGTDGGLPHLHRPGTTEAHGGDTKARETEKDRVRRALRVARHEQLSESAVRAFVTDMETRRRGPHGEWVSIRSLLRDGEELAQSLSAIGSQSSDTELRGVVDPYLQFISEGDRCAWTGLRLADIWRYLRYTWLNPARSTPGRGMMILVRDAAREPHPVVGIAALSSAIVQQSTRDAVIGWDRQGILSEVRDKPSDALAAWLLNGLSQAISGIAPDGLVTEEEIAAPTPEIVARLRDEGARARRQHQSQAGNSGMRRHQAQDHWDEIMHTPLYRSKRASTLADLLHASCVFRAAGFTEPTAEKLQIAAGSTDFQQAVGRIVRQIKAARVGIHMMDINVAGAVAPYNDILGGKLVSLLLLSPEVRTSYARRYGGRPSIIASGMRGKAVSRPADLALLCTTGLFGGGSSQYNRVRLPATKVSPKGSGELRYIRLGHETQFATFHFSQATLAEMKRYAEQWHDGSSIHNIFGEGVNPKMRRIREGVARIGLPAEALLQSGSPRTVYMVPLAHNYQDVLLGRASKPDYILPTPKDEEVRDSTARIAAFWRERWLAGRITRSGVLDGLGKHRLTEPPQHGALVQLPHIIKPNKPVMEHVDHQDEFSLFDEIYN